MTATITTTPQEGPNMPNSWTKWLFQALIEQVARPIHIGRRHPA